ncbi:MAG TPA: histidine--tRNA ligase [Rhodospirillaceae bacterium]|nr:MAG: histidine--tRNA ligase [Alphaproteobacteria bacterium GWF2_58_20]HAU28624.1 histidine--tRNA ligase [Rhodospirillaceae bacterium]
MNDTPQKKSTYRPRPISGFPEMLPEVRLAELAFIDDIRKAFESFGFCSIETPAVEELEVLLAKGETDKEIYILNRLQGEGDDKDARLGLHYDLTVPLARYVAQHFGDLTFPFKRYQIQKVWRGERPQEGRYREFTQCDIDVINVDHLPLQFDAEMPAIAYDIMRRRGISDIVLKLSNRKILAGFMEGLSIAKASEAIRILDKLDKLPHAEVGKLLASECCMQESAIAKCIDLADIRTQDTSFAKKVCALGVMNETLEAGLDELAQVMDMLAELPQGAIEADLCIARGFDYYTGTVYEGKFTSYPDYPTIMAGGRYDDLASAFINKKLPGVGISIGLSRLFPKLLQEGRLNATRQCPTDVLVISPSAERHGLALATSRILRARGLKVELFHMPGKLDRQLKYANKKGIPFVWFPPFEDGMPHEVKNMTTSEQQKADPATWEKPNV